MPFKPGQSGNPRGRPKSKEDVQALARANTTMAIQALVEIAKSGEREQARVQAAEALLNRGWGRPSQAVEHSGPEGGPLTVVVQTLTGGDDGQ